MPNLASVPCRTATWDPVGLGNHRAAVRVDEPADAVLARIPWRRRDPGPERKAILVFDAATGERVLNTVVLEVRAAWGDILFQPGTVPGAYHIYYLPQTQEGWQHQPETRYLLPEETADADWLKRHGLDGPLAAVGTATARVDGVEAMDPGLPRAEVAALEAVDDFHRFDPMEVAASYEEVEALVAGHPERSYLVLPEDRRHPVRMRRHLPLRWMETGVARGFEGRACRSEHYTFQLAVYAARRPLRDVSLIFADLVGPEDARLPAAAFHCVNLGGRDWLGEPISREVSVPAGEVQPLWVGVQVPADARPGRYEGAVTVRATISDDAGDSGPAEDSEIELALEVSEEVLEDGGDGDLWRHARLRWLDSNLGIDDECVDPYPPVKVDGRALHLLGRSVTVGERGLPESITTRFTPSVQEADGPDRELLAGPVRFTAVGADGEVPVPYSGSTPSAVGSGTAAWRARGSGDGLRVGLDARLECDGYLTAAIEVEATADLDLADLRLEIPMRAEFGRYLMGMGHRGGRRTGDWQWQWSDHANHMVWLGDVSGGLQLKLMYETDVWELYSLASHGPPASWGNGGRGGCTVGERGDGAVEVVAYSGPRRLASGERLVFRFGLLITPFHPLDRDHWNWRYFGDGSGEVIAMEEIAASGARVCHLHQGNDLNPHINYPFVRSPELVAYADAAHERDLRLILYYTVRELSNYAAEIWAFRSLGEEIYRQDDGFRLADHFAEESDRPDGLQGKGGSWLWEHLGEGFTPAWHHPLGGPHQDAALATQGLSRLHNYYVEGLNWLVRHTGIDGIYLDGIGYDRQIMKRVRKVLKRARPDTLISFHSGNNFDERYGLNSPAVQYLEHLPYCDNVWFGEGYDYDSQPDYWLVEISGIPFGLSGEMLQGGGNLWRGMLYYGMASRLGWNAESRPQELWRFWDACGIDTMEMFGYWDSRCPVRTDREEVLATVYVGQSSAVIALASWAEGEVTCHLEIGAAGLPGTEVGELRAPAIEEFQPARSFAPGDAIEVPAGRGWLLVVGG